MCFLSPFYTALALWVGALLCGNLLTTELKDQSLKNKFSLREIYSGHMILFLLISVAQAIIVGLAFTVIVYTLVSLLDNIGKALDIIIMVLQIAGVAVLSQYK
ncbi:hypothetical protein KJC15_04350 [Macrococcus caseolyticus]|nr:hypothetical protein [Macrococcus caseolyticus]MCE4956518.1 hypothetical protein [Macrococcus caseolyticus]